MHQASLTESVFQMSSAARQDSGGCSRRALSKQRKLCHNCKRKPACVTEHCPDNSEQLRFCSQKCLEGYKMTIFTQETLACLGKFEESVKNCAPSSISDSPPMDDMFNSSSSSRDVGKPTMKTRASTVRGASTNSGPKAKRRINPPARPHPSYVLNKRYWDELKLHESMSTTVTTETAQNCRTAPVPAVAVPKREPAIATNNQPLPAIVRTSAQSMPVVAPPPLKRSQPIEDAQQLTGVQRQYQVGSVNGIIFLPLPVPMPIPIPILIPEGHILKKRKVLENDDDLD